MKSGSPFGGRPDDRAQTRTSDLERRLRAQEHLMASDVPIDAIAALGYVADVQTALEALAAGLGAKLDAASYTAADVLAKLVTVDGAGSGLDADLLDGHDTTYFAPSARTITAGTGLAGGGDLSSNRTLSLSAGLDLLTDVDTTTTPPTNGQALVWDGSGSLWKPGTVSGGGGSITKIAQVTVTGAVAAKVTFSSIPSTYEDLMFYARTRCDAASVQNMVMQFNGDTAANYDYATVNQNNNVAPGGASAVGVSSLMVGITCASNSANANKFSTTKGEIVQYANTAMEKSAITDSYDNFANTVINERWQRYAGDWRSTAAINKIEFFPGTGNWAIGTVFTLYGRS